jgi:hypothetical protein
MAKKLQDENRHMKEGLCTMPKCEHVDKLQAENKRYREALEVIASNRYGFDFWGVVSRKTTAKRALNVH